MVVTESRTRARSDRQGAHCRLMTPSLPTTGGARSGVSSKHRQQAPYRWLLVVEEVLEALDVQTVDRQGVHLVGRQRPRHRALRLLRLTAPAVDEQPPARRDA